MLCNFFLNAKNNTGLSSKIFNYKFFSYKWSSNTFIGHWFQSKFTLLITCKAQAALSLNKLSASRPDITVFASVSIQPRSCKQFKNEVFKLELGKSASTTWQAWSTLPLCNWIDVKTTDGVKSQDCDFSSNKSFRYRLFYTCFSGLYCHFDFIYPLII